MRCSHGIPCDRDALYEVERVNGAVHDVCFIHARAYEEEGQLRRAIKLTASILAARETARDAATYQRVRREEKREAGICVDCSARAVLGQSRCERHRDARRVGRTNGDRWSTSPDVAAMRRR